MMGADGVRPMSFPRPCSGKSTMRFPENLHEMHVYWRDIGGYRHTSDLRQLFDTLLAAGLTVIDA
ncbi:MAG: hypothetical protein BMS9Abin37_2976 [Acidobacteriota bacterium]|nr:MAG: hypothetical protein BMS9Abin37_2976 [Acidobacteriota bacterium]